LLIVIALNLKILSNYFKRKNKNENLFFTLAILLSISVSPELTFSQATQEWLKFYSGPANGDDVANSIAVDSLGNVYITGSSIILTDWDTDTAALSLVICW